LVTYHCPPRHVPLFLRFLQSVRFEDLLSVFFPFFFPGAAAFLFARVYYLLSDFRSLNLLIDPGERLGTLSPMVRSVCPPVFCRLEFTFRHWSFSDALVASFLVHPLIGLESFHTPPPSGQFQIDHQVLFYRESVRYPVSGHGPPHYPPGSLLGLLLSGT